MGTLAADTVPLLRRSDPHSARRLGSGFLALCALTAGLITLGGLVRAHGAGLACPDWPLCFGQLIPKLNLEVGFEYAHRVLAGSVSLLFTALAVGVLRLPAARARIGWLLLLAAALLGAQILLGALTVWQLLARWTVTAHLLTGNAFAACLLLLGLELRRTGPSAPPSTRGPAGPILRGLLLGAALLLGLQVTLGGLVSSSHAGLACPDWPSCRGGVFFPSWRGPIGLQLMHRVNAYALLAVLCAAVLGCRKGRGPAGPCRLALALAVIQATVGIANVQLGLPVEVTGLHSALAAGLVLTLTATLYRDVRARRSA